MIDEIFDRNYRAGRGDLNATIRAALKRLGRAAQETFAVVHRVQFSAPWAVPAKRVRCG